MMKLNHSRTKIFTLFLTGLVLTQMYQNCGEMSQFEVSEQASLNLNMSSQASDENHPSAKTTDLPVQKIQVVNKSYVAALMREVFTTTAGPVPNLEALIQQWIMSRGAQYGLGCNPYSTYSGRDCGGDISNSNLPTQADANTVRESFHIQFCENILGMDEGVNAILQKLSNRGPAPTADTVKQVYGLFYRGDAAPESIVNTLLDLDRSLALKNETPLERWRALALQVCESPGWQLQ